jgi:hypothetical protein
MDEAFLFFREILEMFTSHLEHIFARFAEGLSRKVSIRIVKWSPSGNPDSQNIPASLSDTMLAGLRGRMDEIITAGCAIFFPELVRRNRGFVKRYGTVDCLEREARKSIHIDLEELREASGEHTAGTSAVHEDDDLLEFGGHFQGGSVVFQIS